MKIPNDHGELIEALGGAAKVAMRTNEKPVTVRAWKARNKIPPEQWPEIISMAREAEVPIDAEWLMQTTPARQRPTTSSAAQAA